MEALGSGRKSAPNITFNSKMAPVIKKDIFHPKLSTKVWVKGAQIKVPKPDPQTAMPVAKARFFSKYMDTQTMAGK